MRLFEDFLDTPNTTEDDLINSNSSSDSSYRPIESYHAIFSISSERISPSMTQEGLLKTVVKILQRYGFETETSEVVVLSVNGNWDKLLWSDNQQHELSSLLDYQNKVNITDTSGKVFGTKYICWFGIDWKFKTLTRLYNFANQLCNLLNGNPYHRVYVYSKSDLKNNLGIDLTNIMDVFDNLINGVHSKSNHFTYGYQGILQLCLLVLDRDDILKHVTEVTKGYSRVNNVLEEARHKIAEDTKYHQGGLKQGIDLALPDDIVEMLSTTGISLDYLFEKVEKTSDTKEKLPHIYVYLRKTFNYFMRFINTKEVRMSALENVAPDMNFKMVDNKYNLFKYYKDQAKLPYHLLTIYGGYFKDIDDCQYYVVLGIMFPPKQLNFLETIKRACKVSLPKQKINEDFIGDMSKDEIVSSDISDVKEDKIEDYQYYVGINIKDSKKTPDEVRRSLHNGLRRIRGIKAISELQVEPMRINNDTVNWKYPKTSADYDDAIHFGIDVDFRLVKEVIMFLVILNKSTDPTVRPYITLYNNESGKDADFRKYNELYHLLLDKKLNVSTPVEQRVDRAYREILMIAMFFNQYKPDSFWQLRRTFDKFDDLMYFFERFESEMKNDTQMVFAPLFYDLESVNDKNDCYSIIMPRQELSAEVLLFNNYFERIADVRSPGGINQVNGNLMKKLPDEIVIEKMVRGQYGAQKQTFGYYIIISFKPVMLNGSLKYAAILLFSHDKHEPVDNLYKKILSYQSK